MNPRQPPSPAPRRHGAKRALAQAAAATAGLAALSFVIYLAANPKPTPNIQPHTEPDVPRLPDVVEGRGVGVFFLRPDADARDPRQPSDPDPVPGFFWRRNPPPGVRRVALLVHGLDEPGGIWDQLAPALADAGFVVARFEYPNDQPIARSAAMLGIALRELAARGVAEVDLVGHSMGGLISYDAVTRPDFAADVQPLRVVRLITLGTPYAGSAWARHRWIAEWREQASRFVHHRNDEQGEALPTEIKGAAGADLLPGSAYLRELAERPRPSGLAHTAVVGRVFTSSGSLGPVSTLIVPANDMLGDGVVSVDSAKAFHIPDTVELNASHRGMLRTLVPGSDASPPAIPIVLDRLRQDGPATNPRQ